MNEQKARLKTQRADELLRALRPHLEAPEVQDSDAPVRQCSRYLIPRREQLDYQNAMARDPPISLGEIESAHRYIVRQRLKRPGAWGVQPTNAEHMQALRINRANRQWEACWTNDLRQAA